MVSLSSGGETHAFLKFLNISTWLISALTTVLYSTVLHPTIRHVSNSHLTPFTTNSIFTAAFWLFLYALQVGFLAMHWSRDSSLRATTVDTIYASFAVFNMLQFGWVLLWVNGEFTVAELFTIFNFLNILRLYLCLGPKLGRPIRGRFSRLLFLEAPTARLPLALLFIDIFHNGAVALHVHGRVGRLLANVLIWSILVVGGGVVAFFRDWVFGLALAYHMLSLAIEQLAIKIIGLQWIFAFVISGVLALLSAAVIIPRTRASVESAVAGHQAQVDSGADEAQRLLG